MTDAARDFLAERHAPVLDLALWVRERVLAAEPDFTERIYRGWDGIGFRHPDAGYVCAIYPRPDEGEVRLLFEHGAGLPDPDGVLQGDGRRTRFLVARELGDDATADRIARYVHAAVTQRLLR
jgi:hypothetical protein